MQLNIILLRRRARVDLSAASRCTPLLPEKKIPLSRTHRQLTTKTAGAIGPNHWSRNCGFELVIIIPKVTTWSVHVNSSIKSYWVHIRVGTIIGGRRWSPMPESVAQQTSRRNSTLEKKCTATKYTHVQDCRLTSHFTDSIINYRSHQNNYINPTAPALDLLIFAYCCHCTWMQ